MIRDPNQKVGNQWFDSGQSGAVTKSGNTYKIAGTVDDNENKNSHATYEIDVTCP